MWLMLYNWEKQKFCVEKKSYSQLNLLISQEDKFEFEFF